MSPPADAFGAGIEIAVTLEEDPRVATRERIWHEHGPDGVIR